MTIATTIRTIIFDLGGVLLRTDDPLPRTQLAKRLGLQRAKLEEIVFDNPLSQQAERGLTSPDEVWTAIAQTLHLSQDEIPVFRKQFFGGDRVDFNLIELIQKLRPAYTTALLSNTWIVDLPKFLREDLRIPDTFDFVISSAHRGMAKPDPQIFRLALDLVKAAPQEVVFVDDAIRNIHAAANLGIRTVHFQNAAQARTDLLAILKRTVD
jgi:epoxide hydrolase-like predicted phosphatase